ncbi:MAG: complex I NDUFA9 subunit family protein [Pseudomonadota bacterium]
MVNDGGNGRLVTIFGGSGFVGRYTVRALAKRGWRIRAAVRRPDLAGHLQPMGGVGQIQAVQANLRYPQSVAAAVEGADAVVNLVGILAGTGSQTFTKIHDEGARTVAQAARDAGATQMVHLSAIGADASSPGNYGRTKAAGESAVLEVTPSARILRPSIVFGPEDQFFNRFADLAMRAPALPLIGGGRTRFQPVYVNDVALALANAVEGAGTPGTIYELGGPDIITFRKLLERVKEWTGRRPGFAPMPFFAAKLLGLATWPLPNALRPITVDQVRMLQSDNVVSAAALEEGRTLAALGVEQPHTIASIVPDYLVRFRPKGQYSRYR